MPMTPVQINAIFTHCYDNVTHQLTVYGEAAQLQAHPDPTNIVRSHIANRASLAAAIGGAAQADVRSAFPAGNPLHVVPVPGVGPGNIDIWGGGAAVIWGSPEATLSPANRALAMCIVGLNDQIADITANRGVGGSRIADGAALDGLDTHTGGIGPLNTHEIAAWVAANPGVVVQARLDIDALLRGVELASLGGAGIGQEAVTSQTVIVLGINNLDKTRRSEAAENRFGGANFDAIPDLTARRAAVVTAQAGIGGLGGLLPGEAHVYGIILQEKINAIDTGVLTARARFAAVESGFDAIADLAARRAAVVAAEATIGALALGVDEEDAYRALLVAKIAAIDAAIGAAAAAQITFDAHDFVVNFPDLELRRQAIVAAQNASLLDMFTPAAEKAIYDGLLANALAATVALQAAAALARFNGQNFVVNFPDLEVRRLAIEAEQTLNNAAGGIVGIAQAAYAPLLAQAIIDTAAEGPAVALARFNVHAFVATHADLEQRRQAIEAAQGASAGLGVGMHAAERAVYDPLLAQAIIDTAAEGPAAALARFNRHDFSTNFPDLEQRRQAIEAAQGASAGLGAGMHVAERAAYDPLLTQVLDATVAVQAQVAAAAAAQAAAQAAAAAQAVVQPMTAPQVVSIVKKRLF
jgi:hypothetical protein